jgi:hypothetical protein
VKHKPEAFRQILNQRSQSVGGFFHARDFGQKNVMYFAVARLSAFSIISAVDALKQIDRVCLIKRFSQKSFWFFEI